MKCRSRRIAALLVAVCVVVSGCLPEGPATAAGPGSAPPTQAPPAQTPPGNTPAATGTAALSWTPPTHNTDGSVLTDLAGYYVYYGRSPGALNDRIELQGTGSISHEFTGLASGMHYFAVSAYNTTFVESARSGVASKLVP